MRTPPTADPYAPICIVARQTFFLSRLQYNTHVTFAATRPPQTTTRCHSSNLVAGRKRDELDVRGGQGVVAEGALDGVEVVRPDGDEGAPPADVLVQLVLHDSDRPDRKTRLRFMNIETKEILSKLGETAGLKSFEHPASCEGAGAHSRCCCRARPHAGACGARSNTIKGKGDFRRHRVRVPPSTEPREKPRTWNLSTIVVQQRSRIQS